MSSHKIIFYCCSGITVIVFSILTCSLIKQRRLRATITHFHRHTYSDLCWALIPLLILIALVFPAAYNLIKTP